MEDIPFDIVVEAINSTTAKRLVSGVPRQFSVMWQNIRCSILFHLLVPGGKWHTEIRSPVSAANRAVPPSTGGSGSRWSRLPRP